jgi:hypothetical protein
LPETANSTRSYTTARDTIRSLNAFRAVTIFDADEAMDERAQELNWLEFEAA